MTIKTTNKKFALIVSLLGISVFVGLFIVFGVIFSRPDYVNQVYANNCCNEWNNCTNEAAWINGYNTCASGGCSSCKPKGPSGPVCGNGSCEGGENESNCSADCNKGGQSTGGGGGTGGSTNPTQANCEKALCHTMSVDGCKKKCNGQFVSAPGECGGQPCSECEKIKAETGRSDCVKFWTCPKGQKLGPLGSGQACVPENDSGTSTSTPIKVCKEGCIGVRRFQKANCEQETVSDTKCPAPDGTQVGQTAKCKRECVGVRAQRNEKCEIVMVSDTVCPAAESSAQPQESTTQNISCPGTHVSEFGTCVRKICEPGVCYISGKCNSKGTNFESPESCTKTKTCPNIATANCIKPEVWSFLECKCVKYTQTPTVPIQESGVNASVTATPTPTANPQTPAQNQPASTGQVLVRLDRGEGVICTFSTVNIGSGTIKSLGQNCFDYSNIGLITSILPVEEPTNQKIKFIPQVHAQEIEQIKVGSGGMISLKPGAYVVSETSSNLSSNTFEVLVKEGSNASFKVFKDLNNNKIKDSNEPFLTEGTVVSISKKYEVMTYVVNEGWNLVAFPFILQDQSTKEPLKASEMVKELSKGGIEITHIAKYKDGQFYLYTNRGDTLEYGDDFSIIPSESYFIKAQKGGVMRVTGSKITSSIPITLSNGWNLVGIVSAGKSYTAEAMLDSINGASIEADTVSRYTSGMYQNVIKEDGILYGNDYNILDFEGYFLRVKSGGGKTWTP